MDTLIVLSPRPAAFVLKTAIGLGQILPLQPVDDFVRSNREAHVSRHPARIGDRHANHDVPVWMHFQQSLQCLDDARSDHVEISDLNFLLEAALGLISVEQNAAMKLFSWAALVFLPPTLIAGIYGMNFEHMPELGWLYGYPMALTLIVASAIVPLWVLKRRGWI